jgi:Uma2 family endonuclease
MSISVKEIYPLRIENLESLQVPEKFIEILEGELVQMTPAGRIHNRIALNFICLFKDFCSTHPELTYGGDNEGFLVQRSPDSLLSPDACLFRKRPDTGTTWMEFAPEIAVEVLSPSNSPAEMLYKRKLYFEAGTEQFWVANPQTSELVLYPPNHRMITVSGDETILGEGIVEGLEINLPALFDVD